MQQKPYYILVQVMEVSFIQQAAVLLQQI